MNRFLWNTHNGDEPKGRWTPVVDVNVITAFVAGALAFFSPCVLPIVPAYLAFIASRGSKDGGPVGRSRRFGLTACFVLGFGLAFTIIGFLIGSVGGQPAFQSAQVWLRRIGGVLIIAFGFAMLGLWRMPWMDRDVRYHGRLERFGPVTGSVLLGAAFGVGWTPCVGPILASILLQAGLGGSGAQGAFLLACFSLGLAVPFLLFGLVADQGAGFIHRHAKATRVVEIVGGVFLVLLGIMVFTGAVNRFLLYVGWGS